ncbi:iron-sulfur flavoprotein [candidate division WOR_3 bacterium SM23_60]|uniref:Iron-sulfur flavoprotein n=1 Tax=candidate division WOR_3 bacterium SM23_60 TaxID=1703780 RepID=A0A0S8GHH6_UNCW3|nr:MAG: iron-sulfur flavoprotein [candidate division WOR_3 bacterium SM23_60]
MKAVAINGSPRKDKGNTGMILNAFIQGMKDAGAEVEIFYTKNLKPKPCTGEMKCWWETPGECYIKDNMQKVYPVLREADTLILATPVYIPLPGEMQIVINRLCPLAKPLLETRGGRTRGRLHDNVMLRKLVLVSTGGWWEKENLDTVVRIAEEIAENMSIEFSGAVLRPHAFLMKKKGELTEDGAAIIDVVTKAGYEFVKNGRLGDDILETVRRPLISQEELLQRYNKALESL